LLQLLKDVRQWTKIDYHADSAVDCVSYAALKAESLAVWSCVETVPEELSNEELLKINEKNTFTNPPR
jgi:hypothetical protein